MMAFKELDHDADGFIPQDELVQYLTMMGEGLHNTEIDYMLNIANDPNSPKNE